MWILLVVGAVAIAGTPVTAQCQISLSPKSVVVGFGDSFSVNCISLSNQTSSMGWESEQDGIPLTEGVSSLALQIKSVKLWLMNPKCFINLKDDSQCSDNLPVTVYKMPGSVSISRPSQPLLEGEKYTVQCNVTDVAPVRNVTVLWHRGNETYATETFRDPVKTPVNKTSELELIASRDDNGAQIWCEAKLNFVSAGLHLPPTRSESQEVTVLYPPTFDKPENETLQVSAAEVILNCKASGNPAPAYSWDSPEPPQQTDPYQHQLILARSLQIPGTYSCTASNTQGTATKYFTLVKATGSRPGTTAGILITVFFVVIFLLGCVVYQKQRKSPV